jgi:hypothetical protein
MWVFCKFVMVSMDLLSAIDDKKHYVEFIVHMESRTSIMSSQNS